MAEQTRWEYRIESVAWGTAEQRLNELGEAGWELVSVDDDRWVLKRPKSGDAPDTIIGRKVV